MAQKYGKLEKRVLDLFEVGTSFEYENKTFKVLKSDKPRTSKGEPKTDAYISIQEVITPSNIINFKISCKLANENEFQENKIRAERAFEIWGSDWRETIKEAALNNANNFLNTQVFFPEGARKTKESMLTNGWKLEITNKYRALSHPLEFEDQQVRDIIYKGLTLDESKKHAKVHGEVIADSGVAEYILVCTVEELASRKDVLEKMVLIDHYPIVQHYIIFTANNLRILKKKSDGNRPLAVQLLWQVDELDDTKMKYRLNCEHPLDPCYSGEKIAQLTLEQVKQLNPLCKERFI
ncbi:hypothetical protein [Saccharibacillus sp. JS10]|uniref:hypothetical protein n=1 Tax=Saccharibacillus sp. JS10 TaxID=2950552 RepID=UPI00210B95C7|nr:hypothetical protein [Saccharibacillus sp. JS10]MCQ4087292.1 hypothetical protein [Saccharibacillus sp. JS10]